MSETDKLNGGASHEESGQESLNGTDGVNGSESRNDPDSVDDSEILSGTDSVNETETLSGTDSGSLSGIEERGGSANRNEAAQTAAPNRNAAESLAKAMKASPLGARISSEVNLDTLLKVPVSLSIEVGRTRLPLSQVLETREGTVIELERLLDEPLDILVNGALIAHGVVVMANDRFGIQITDIVSPQERVRNI